MTYTYVHTLCLSNLDLLYLLSRHSCPVACVEGPQDYSGPSAQLETGLKGERCGQPDCYLNQAARNEPKGEFIVNKIYYVRI